MSFRQKLVWVVLAIFIVGAVIAALVLSVYHLPSDGTTPEATVSAFFDGWAARDSARMVALIDPGNRPAAREVETLFESSVTSFSELKFRTVAQTSEKSTVRVTGSLSYDVSGEKGRVPIDMQIPLVRRNGKWYLETMAVVK